MGAAVPGVHERSPRSQHERGWTLVTAVWIRAIAYAKQAEEPGFGASRIVLSSSVGIYGERTGMERQPTCSR